MLNEAYRATEAQMLVALDRVGVRPGPLEHDAVWVRDAAYVGEALLWAGHLERVEDLVPHLFEHQESDGRVPPIIEDGAPRSDLEWDSQGQVAFLVTQTYLHNRDLDFARRWYPGVREAMAFLVELRRETATSRPEVRGLLPPSRSAEDLGPPHWHHYWDNFWAVAGLEKAAILARELGHDADAAWMEAEANELREAIRDSIEVVMGPDPEYIPGAPENLDTSAMARGTNPVLVPIEVFDRADPLVISAFETYYQRWIEPDEGGFRHLHAQFWPYGGLALARNYLRLGRLDVVHEILGWTIENQTLEGTYAWAEQVDPETGAISGGDMPHAWAAASFHSLVREMVVMRREDRLELLAGAPRSWLDADQEIRLDGMPTAFGPLSLRTESTLDPDRNDLHGTLSLFIDGAAPPAGFRWRLLASPDRFEAPAGTRLDGDALVIPPEGGTVTLFYGDAARPGGDLPPP